MINSAIQDKLRDNHLRFADFIISLDDQDFLFSPEGKWTAGQQLDHIYRSVSALNKGLALPKPIIRLMIGSANRPSKDYDALVLKYKAKLGQGGRAMGRFVPKALTPERKIASGEKLIKTVDSLCRKVAKYNEKELDYYILPHPLLGKLTIREMLYFTIYHAEHHRLLTIKNLERK